MNPRYLDLALRLALKSSSRYRLGAVIINRRKILGMGFNKMGKSHPQMQKYVNGDWVPGLHAEVHAALGIPPAELEGATVYVGRVWRDGTPSLARPCGMCERFLRDVGVGTVYYSTMEGYGKIDLTS